MGVRARHSRTSHRFLPRIRARGASFCHDSAFVAETPGMCASQEADCAGKPDQVRAKSQKTWGSARALHADSCHQRKKLAETEGKCAKRWHESGVCVRGSSTKAPSVQSRWQEPGTCAWRRAHDRLARSEGGRIRRHMCAVLTRLHMFHPQPIASLSTRWVPYRPPKGLCGRSFRHCP